MRPYLLSVLFLLVSCVIPRSVGVTSFGIPVSAHTYAHDVDEIGIVIDAVIQETVERLGGYYSRANIEEKLHYYAHNVEIEDGPFKCGLEYCSGTYNHHTLTIRYAYSPCIAYSALAHEVAHMLQWIIGYEIDINHRDARFWGVDGIVQKVNEKIGVLLCRKKAP